MTGNVPKITPLTTRRLQGFRITERQLHEYIRENPLVLGIPDVRVCDSEKQSGDGRLDLLLESTKYYNRRYVVEIQRGEPDESHIIRTLEYLASEQKHSEEYDHYAVIVAEDIAQGRFFKVLSYLNSYHIPVIAIEVKAVELSPGSYGFVFTRVLEYADDFDTPQVSGEHWHDAHGGDVLELVNKFCAQLGDGVKPYFTKHYAGVDDPKNGRTSKCVVYPRKGSISVEFYMPESPEWNKDISQNKLTPKYISGRYYRFPIGGKTDMEKHADLWRRMYYDAAGITDDKGQTGVDDASN